MLKNLSNNQILLILLVVGIVVYTYSKKTQVVEGWVESCRSRVNKTSRKAYRKCSKDMYACYRETSKKRPRNRKEWLAIRDARIKCRKEVGECYKPLRTLVKEVQNECEVEERGLRNEHKEKILNSWVAHKEKIEAR